MHVRHVSKQRYDYTKQTNHFRLQKSITADHIDRERLIDHLKAEHSFKYSIRQENDYRNYHRYLKQ